jgi:hypothetical protein
MTPRKYSTCRSRLNRKFPAWLAAVPGAGRNVGFLVGQRHAAGDAVVFDPRVPTHAVVVQVGTDIVVVQIVADVPIKFAVIEIAGVALFRGPDLVGRFHVPAEKRHPAGGINGGETRRTAVAVWRKERRGNPGRKTECRVLSKECPRPGRRRIREARCPGADARNGVGSLAPRSGFGPGGILRES